VARGIENVAKAFAAGKSALDYIGQKNTNLQDFFNVPQPARNTNPFARAAGGPVMAGQPVPSW
jgi:hypothetical protein